MATYNGEKYLREQISSILAELGEEDELVVSDDGSTDSTCSIIESFGDTRIRLLKNSGRHGVNGNFENAVENAKGEYIFLSDQDDVWIEGKVDKCLRALKKADLVLHDGLVTDKDLIPQNKTMFCELNVKKGFLNNLIKNRFTGCCMAFRREILRYVFPLPDTTNFYHDNWIGLMASVKGRVSILNEGLIYFRRHGSNNSTAGTASRLSFQEKIKYRLSLVKFVIFRILGK